MPPVKVCLCDIPVGFAQLNCTVKAKRVTDDDYPFIFTLATNYYIAWSVYGVVAQQFDRLTPRGALKKSLLDQLSCRDYSRSEFSFNVGKNIALVGPQHPDIIRHSECVILDASIESDVPCDGRSLPDNLTVLLDQCLVHEILHDGGEIEIEVPSMYYGAIGHPSDYASAE